MTGGVGQGVAGVDFFVSHAGRDQAWAEWVAWHLVENHPRTRKAADNLAAALRLLSEAEPAPQGIYDPTDSPHREHLPPT